jgi:hypothetical protein
MNKNLHLEAVIKTYQIPKEEATVNYRKNK